MTVLSSHFRSMKFLAYLFLSATLVVGNPTCHSSTISLQNVSAPSFELSFEIRTQWDVTDWTINEARRDSATAFNGTSGVGTTVGDFDISARFCAPEKAGGDGRERTVLVLTHGLGADKSYWDPTFDGGERYSLVQAALKAGYSVFHYDRLGTGNSTKPDPHNVVQFSIQVEILTRLTQLLLDPSSSYSLELGALKPNITAAVHFGHSYGSYITAALASAYPELTQGISLSGYSGIFDYFNILIAGWQSRVAALLSPEKWGHLPHGYITPVDEQADAYLDFKAPFFEHRVADWTTRVKSPYAVGELATLGQKVYNTSDFSKPVQVFQGRYDLSACGGNCDGVLNRTALLWPQASPLNISGTFPAGHSVNLHLNASDAFAVMLDFVSRNVGQS